MAQQLIDEINKCFLCKRIFTAQMPTFTISLPSKKMNKRQMVCGSCHNSHMSKGE